MEKYKRFADKGTGVNPFTPFVPKPQQGSALVLQRAKLYLMAPVLVPLRLALSLLLLPLFWLFAEALPWLTCWAWPVSRPIARGSSFLLGRLWLLVLGFYRIPHVPFPFHEIRPNSFAYTPQHPEANPDGSARHPTRPQQLSPAARDLVLATHSSYIDVLYFATYYAPVFAFPVPGHPGLVLPLGPLAALWQCSATLDAALRRPAAAPPPTAVTLAALLARARRRHQPVVLFPEGVTTNGRAVLEFDVALFDGLTDVQRATLAIQMVMCRYDGAAHFSPTFPVGSAAAHSLGLCSQGANPLTVRYVRPAEIPALPATGSCEKWCAAVRQKFGAAAPMAVVSLSSRDKAQFLEQWDATQGDYKKAA